MSFNNKVVIVTGASSGIGAVTAVTFSSEGAQVVLVARNESKLAAVAKQCKDPLVIIADVANDADARKIIVETIRKFGQIDVLINNAGTGIRSKTLLEGDVIKYYDITMGVNLRAVVHLTSLASQYLVKTKGNIVNISSAAAQLPPFGTGTTNYCVSKAGLDHFTKCAAAELGPHGVRVNAVSPGPVVTDILENSNLKVTWNYFTKFTLLNRVSHPEEIADLVLFLSSDKAKGITGSILVSDNGSILMRSVTRRFL